MFCSKCGKKLLNEATTCSNCGTPASLAEYCGGFWNLVGEKPPVQKAPISAQKEPAPAAEEKKVVHPPITEEKKLAQVPKVPAEKPQRKKPIFWYTLSALLLLLLLVQTIRVAHFSSHLEKSQAAYAGIKAELDDMHETLDTLSEAVVSLVTPADDAQEQQPEEPSTDEIDMQAIYDSIEEIRELLLSSEQKPAEEPATAAPSSPSGDEGLVMLPAEPPAEEVPVGSTQIG